MAATLRGVPVSADPLSLCVEGATHGVFVGDGEALLDDLIEIPERGQRILTLLYQDSGFQQSGQRHVLQGVQKLLPSLRSLSICSLARRRLLLADRPAGAAAPRRVSTQQQS